MTIDADEERRALTLKLERLGRCGQLLLALEL
jgi:hypothetical protein